LCIKLAIIPLQLHDMYFCIMTLVYLLL
jgi:hypothetical protein